MLCRYFHGCGAFLVAFMEMGWKLPGLGQRGSPHNGQGGVWPVVLVLGLLCL